MKKKVLKEIERNQKIIESLKTDIFREIKTKYVNYNSIKLYVEKIQKCEHAIGTLQLLYISL